MPFLAHNMWGTGDSRLINIIYLASKVLKSASRNKMDICEKITPNKAIVALGQVDFPVIAVKDLYVSVQYGY